MNNNQQSLQLSNANTNINTKYQYKYKQTNNNSINNTKTYTNKLKCKNLCFKGRFPCRQNLPTLIKIPQKTISAISQMKDLLNNLSTQKYPQYLIRWRLACCKLDQALSIKLLCKSQLYKCDAFLRYHYDEDDHCYYLYECSNKHHHVQRQKQLRYKNKNQRNKNIQYANNEKIQGKQKIERGQEQEDAQGADAE